MVWKSGDLEYPVSKIMDVLSRQATVNVETGGGITCEPGNVYPSCQGHHFASYRLHDALSGSTDFPAYRDAWRQWLIDDNIWGGLDGPNGRLGDRLFRVTQALPQKAAQHPHLMDPDFEYNAPIGCAAHDAWVMVSFVPRDRRLRCPATPALTVVVAAAVDAA